MIVAVFGDVHGNLPTCRSAILIRPQAASHKRRVFMAIRICSPEGSLTARQDYITIEPIIIHLLLADFYRLTLSVEV